MRTITLELLRHGQAHNQLLSPLTPYLALCENHSAVTLHVPFEHNQFLHRLSALGYKISEESRVFQLQDTANVLSELLAMIPGLTAESNKVDGKEVPLTHLRLIISASELALLPFELALSPNGLPGAGQPLLLQPQMPLCLTREIRRVPSEPLQWPKKLRILFVAAQPSEVGAIPLESHLLTLRRAISPWVKYFDSGDETARSERVEEHLHFLPGASIQAIEEACASGSFTHVHILAHGVEKRENYDTRFFLALHHAQDPSRTDYVSGARLATALRASQRPDSGALSRPLVVTLASCDSGNVGSVAGAGASIAHALHESGIPMVVASQFPLSFDGSVRLVECLYEGLLWGTDPRRLLYDLRRRLYAQFQQTHDWASLIAYVSLPPDFDQQLAGIMIDRAHISIEAAMNHADEAISRILKSSTELKTAVPDERNQANHDLLQSALQKIEKAKGKLSRLLKYIPAESLRITSLLASTEKRQAEVKFSAFKSPVITEEGQKSYEESKKLLQGAIVHYWDTFLLNRSDSWPLVQYLSLRLISSEWRVDKAGNAASKEQGNRVSPPRQEQSGTEDLNKEWASLWFLARQLSQYELQTSQGKQTSWVHGNLLELYLLSLALPEKQALLPDMKEAKRCALEHTNMLIKTAGQGSFEVYSTQRQIARYVKWFNEIADLTSPLTELAEDILYRFPPVPEETWK